MEEFVFHLIRHVLAFGLGASFGFAACHAYALWRGH
jgi:hypothetical protein